MTAHGWDNNEHGASGASEMLLEIQGLKVEYQSGRRSLRAVDGVDLKLRRGEVLGITGESGSGKSTLAYAIARLLRPPGVITAGNVLYYRRNAAPVDVLDFSDEQLQAFRWAELAIVFQNAMSALNPVLSLRAQLEDVLVAHRPEMSREERAERMRDLLNLVGISIDRLKAFPHELSGGMRQRAIIAIALALGPEIVIMDEPTTSLDVVMQQQILDEMMELRVRLGFAVVFITHDLSLLVENSDTIAVMYAGRVVEKADARELYGAPRHPYTRGLLNSFPVLRGPKRSLAGIVGSPPDLRAVPAGCAFKPRCSHAFSECAVTRPELRTTGLVGDGAGHEVACLLYNGTTASSGEGEPPGEADAG